MAKATTTSKSTPEVVDGDGQAPGVSEPGAGTEAGESIASTSAHGEAAPAGGATPEATASATVSDDSAKIEGVLDGATNQSAPGSAPSRETPMADTNADAGGTQAGGQTALPAQLVQDGELADSANGAGRNTDGSVADSHTVDPASWGADVHEALASNIPATPPNVRVADGVAEALSSTEAQTTSFATQGREAPAFSGEFNATQK